MDEEKVKGFADIVVSKNVTDGINHIIQTAGLGGLKHNTVIICWPQHWRQKSDDRSWKVFIGMSLFFQPFPLSKHYLVYIIYVVIFLKWDLLWIFNLL